MRETDFYQESETTKPAQLKTALQRSADDLGKKGTDAIYSKGRLNVLQLLTLGN